MQFYIIYVMSCIDTAIYLMTFGITSQNKSIIKEIDNNLLYEAINI